MKNLNSKGNEMKYAVVQRNFYRPRQNQIGLFQTENDAVESNHYEEKNYYDPERRGYCEGGYVFDSISVHDDKEDAIQEYRRWRREFEFENLEEIPRDLKKFKPFNQLEPLEKKENDLDDAISELENEF